MSPVATTHLLGSPRTGTQTNCSGINIKKVTLAVFLCGAGFGIGVGLTVAVNRGIDHSAWTHGLIGGVLGLAPSFIYYIRTIPPTSEQHYEPTHSHTLVNVPPRNPPQSQNSQAEDGEGD